MGNNPNPVFVFSLEDLDAELSVHRRLVCKCPNKMAQKSNRSTHELLSSCTVGELSVRADLLAHSRVSEDTFLPLTLFRQISGWEISPWFDGRLSHLLESIYQLLNQAALVLKWLHCKCTEAVIHLFDVDWPFNPIGKPCQIHKYHNSLPMDDPHPRMIHIRGLKRRRRLGRIVSLRSWAFDQTLTVSTQTH